MLQTFLWHFLKNYNLSTILNRRNVFVVSFFVFFKINFLYFRILRFENLFFNNVLVDPFMLQLIEFSLQKYNIYIYISTIHCCLFI